MNNNNNYYYSQKISFTFYCALFLGTLLAISNTCYHYPLIPFQMNNQEWTSAWLIATVIDYYGSTLCFAGIVLASEPHWKTGGLWIISFLLLGSPCCCLYMCLKLWHTGSIKLEASSSSRTTTTTMTSPYTKIDS